MDYFHGLLPLVASVIAFLVFSYFLLRSSSCSFLSGNKGLTIGKKVLPEPPGKWPLIGHLHLLRGPKLLHVVLGEMADKYGPIFSIRLGLRHVIVVSSWEMAKECFSATNDLVFSIRPKSIAVETMGYNYAILSYCPYGPYWREIRKIATSELLTNRRLGMLSHVWESEVKEAIRVTYKQCVDSKVDDVNLLIEMQKWFDNITMNTTCRLMVGRHLSKEEGEICRTTFKQFLDLMGVFAAGDVIPYLRWFDIGGHEKVMKKTGKVIDNLLQRWLDEHKRKKKRNIVEESTYDRQWSFMEALVNLVNEDVAATIEGHTFDVDTIIKATCLNLAIASSESMTISLTWTLTLLLNNRETLKKAQEELDIHVGGATQVKESDMSKLVYLEAIIKESLRLHPPTQISLPREAIKDCYVGGYHVPAGTQLLVNFWKIHRHAGVWVYPCEFKPERFLVGGENKDVDMRGQHFELIPFGGGRRICPVISYALQVMKFTLASLLHGFEFTNTSHETVDMTESSGLTSFKVTPLKVTLTPRLPAQVYE